jgi:hypothetical protein
MEWERYEVEQKKEGMIWKFFSDGPKGLIRKLVEFQHAPYVGFNVYNLFLGDYDEGKDRADDGVISDNGDYKIILWTVMWIIGKFVNLYPQSIILIRGTTASRSRLFQMGIALAWVEIQRRNEVWGRRANKWSPFEKGINYEEFLVFKKIS